MRDLRVGVFNWLPNGPNISHSMTTALDLLLRFTYCILWCMIAPTSADVDAGMEDRKLRNSGRRSVEYSETGDTSDGDKLRARAYLEC